MEPPPIVVGIVGPPKVGKSTLMRGLIKNFTKQNLTNIQVSYEQGTMNMMTYFSAKFFEFCTSSGFYLDILKYVLLAFLLGILHNVCPLKY